MIKLADRLGYAGLIPFVGLAFQFEDETSVSAFMSYAAVILSFLGGIHWGVAMRDQRLASNTVLAVSMLPSLLAWFAMLLPINLGLVISLLAYITWWAWDVTHIEDSDYRRLRTHLTIVVSICHLWLIAQLN